jgi:hypothetical protein
MTISSYAQGGQDELPAHKSAKAAAALKLLLRSDSEK